ncbi:D-alanine--D-alanine ligase family protein [Myroides odoratus]|uniref:D-alanine--D-alanine ligase n=1 Tax=Myroides odoratus TaxID=256 RepID=A0A9Q7E985_MYROD|nr:D-alanine--D-alanine ligase [Myroides odoratus]EHQ43185.1 D-alanine--D-alanine ligase domain protein [Myroides odoratus DSM 2801]EKB06570.1 D-alanine-D-alanine ligase [Myroides odoratus CIP 103059]QQU00528.1 D-alanine--D-alanine ligase [Myroides odoratus]WQD57239.1 D-alanine--D-alanine ligase [Myroides odoratus]STZ30459.1 D-alanine--D-alanine ligase [Myroides odoratus]
MNVQDKDLIVILGNQENKEFYQSIVETFSKVGWEIQILKLDVHSLFFSKLIELNPSIVLFTPSDFSIKQKVYSEFGFVQGFLECHNMRYSGSGSTASFLGSNKYLSKIIFQSLGIKTPRFIYVSENQTPPDYDKVKEELGFNIIIKPNKLGDSVGINIIRNEDEYFEWIKILQEEYQSDFLLEELIDNDKTEYTTGILEYGNDSIRLPICKTRTFTDFFSHESKINGFNEKEYIIDIECDTYKEMQRIAYLLHKEFKCKNFSRTDFLIDKEHNIYVLEINLLPGLMPNSIFPQLCLRKNISHDEILLSLINH